MHRKYEFYNRVISLIKIFKISELYIEKKMNRFEITPENIL